MEPQWTSSFQHSTPLCRHAPRLSSWICGPPDIHQSSLHDREDQRSSLHGPCLLTSSWAFPNCSSDVRNGPLPHCCSSLYCHLKVWIFFHFKMSLSIFQAHTMATVTEVMVTGNINAMVIPLNLKSLCVHFETFWSISQFLHNMNHFHHLRIE